MASVNNFKTIEDLNKLAKSYKTDINNLLLKSINNISTYDNYSMSESSVEQFNNIVNFYLNSSVKDSDTLDNADNKVSSTFKDLLLKYYEDSLNINDIYVLLSIIAKYNIKIENFLNDNLLKLCFGLTSNYSQDSYYSKLCIAIKEIISETLHNGTFIYDTVDAYFEDVYSNVNGVLYGYMTVENNGVYLSKKETIDNEDIYTPILFIASKQDIGLNLADGTYDDILRFDRDPNNSVNNGTVFNNDTYGNFRRIRINDYTKNIYCTFIGDISIENNYVVFLKRGTDSQTFYKKTLIKDNIFNFDLSNNITVKTSKNDSGQLVLKFKNSELIYSLNDSADHHTGYFLKETFQNWISGNLNAFDFSTISVEETMLYNKNDFYDKLLNSNYIEMCVYVYLINKLNIPGKYSIVQTDMSENRNISIQYVYENNVKSELYYMTSNGEYAFQDFNAEQQQYRVVRSALVNSDSIDYSLINEYMPLLTNAIIHKVAVKGISGSLNTTLYINSYSSENIMVEYGHVEYINEKYFKFETNSNNILDMNELFNNYMSKFLRLFYSESNNELAPKISLNSMTDLTYDVFFDNLIDSYLRTYKVEEYKNIMIDKSKILYRFMKNPASTGMKLSAYVDEVTETQQNKLVSAFNLIDVTLNPDQLRMFQNIGKVDGVGYFASDLGYFSQVEGTNNYTLTSPTGNIDDLAVQVITTDDINSSNQYSFSIGVIYKELNPLYRDIEKSDIVELIISLLNSEGSDGNGKVFTVSETDRLVTSSLDNFIRTKEGSLLSNDVTSLVSSLYCNPYNCRKARESDIIQYCEGSFINYGLDNTEKKEIQTFLEIYQETREVFYRNLLNKSFTQDENYDAFEKFMLATVAIERFLSSKIDNIHNIDYFDATDIHNFLQTYGMSILEETGPFIGKTDYQKIVIRNFNKLTRLKGSSAVIDEIIKTFSNNTIDIDINKYILADYQNLESYGTVDNDSNYVSNINKYYTIEIFDDSYKDTFKVSGGLNGKASIVNRAGIKFNGYKNNDGELLLDRFGRCVSFTDPDFTNTVYTRLINLVGIATGSGNIDSNLSPAYETLSPASVASGVAMITPSGVSGTKESLEIRLDNHIKSSEAVNLKNFLYYIDQCGLVKILKKYFHFKISYNIDGKTNYRYYDSPAYNADLEIAYNDFRYDQSQNKLYLYYLVDSEEHEMVVDIDFDMSSYSIVPEDRTKYVTCGICYRNTIIDNEQLTLKSTNNTTMIESSTINADRTIGFIESKYLPENETREIINNISNIKNYDTFVQSDPYWDSEIITEDLIKDMNINLVTSKYSAFDLSTNIFDNLIRSRYCISLIEYLHEKLLYISTNGSSSILENILFGSTLISGFSGNLSLTQFYTIVKLLYKLTIITKYKVNSNNADFNLDDNAAIYGAEYANSGKYYGINANGSIKKLFTRLYGEDNIFTTEALGRIYAIRNKSGYTFKYKNDFYDAEYKLVSNIELGKEYFIQDDNDNYIPIDMNNINNFYNAFEKLDIFNPYENSYDGISSAFKIDSTKYPKIAFTPAIKLSSAGSKFLNQFKEIKLSASINKGRDSSEEVKDYLYGMNYLSLMNDPETIGAAWPLYLAECADSDTDNKFYGIRLENLDRSVYNIYSLMIEKILKLPIDYLSGIKNPSYGNLMHIDNTFNDFLDEAYKEFYLSDKNELELTLNLSQEESKLLKSYPQLASFILNKMYNIDEVVDNNTHQVTGYKLSPVSTELTIDNLTTMNENLINWMNEINSILESELFMQVIFQLDSNTQNLTTFIIAAIKLFISYTSEICEVRTTQKYESDGEYLSPYDYMNIHSKDYMADMVYYDDKLVVKKIINKEVLNVQEEGE